MSAQLIHISQCNRPVVFACSVNLHPAKENYRDLEPFVGGIGPFAARYITILHLKQGILDLVILALHCALGDNIELTTGFTGLLLRWTLSCIEMLCTMLCLFYWWWLQLEASQMIHVQSLCETFLLDSFWEYQKLYINVQLSTVD